MAIYTGKTNMIDKVVVTNGSTPEEMDYVYVTNAAGKRELVFEQKPPAPDDNTQTNPPIMRKWGAFINTKGSSIGKLFWGNPLQTQIVRTAHYKGGSTVSEYNSITNQFAPALTLSSIAPISGVNGNYIFSTRTAARQNGWARLGSFLRYPTVNEIGEEARLEKPTSGGGAAYKIRYNSGWGSLVNTTDKVAGEIWSSTSTSVVRKSTMLGYLYSYNGNKELSITPFTPNGTYSLNIPHRGYMEFWDGHKGNSIFEFTNTVSIVFKRTSNYDEITVTGSSILGIHGATKSQSYTVRLNKNIMSEDEPPITDLVETTNITRGVGGNPKAFRMGDEFNFAVDVRGEYV